MIANGVNLKPHDPNWTKEFLREAELLTQIMGDSIESIHHIGSTAIPQICAKPIIDMLGIADDLMLFDKNSADLARINYEALGEFGIVGRRYFRKHDSSGNRTHHLHVYQTGAPQIVRHLAFRDYLVAHPSEARAYEALKLSLAGHWPRDSRRYTRGKEQFINEMGMIAMSWFANRRT